MQSIFGRQDSKSFNWFVFIGFFIFAPTQADDWQTSIDTESLLVTVSRADDMIKINAKVFIRSSPDAFLALLDSANHDCSWLAHCTAVKIYPSQSPTVRIVHTILSSPWPLQDREMFTRSTHQFSPSGDHLSILVEDISQHFPIHPNRVMLRNVTAQWSMAHSHDDWYELNYLGSAHPGGVIPDWLAEKAMQDATEETMLAIKERLNDE